MLQNKEEYYNWFTPEHLDVELRRLVKLFLPGYKLPKDVEVVVGAFNSQGFPSRTVLDPFSLIIMYENYHKVYPDRYQLTLLFEAGHFFFGSDFAQYPTYHQILKRAQRDIEEEVIPDDYDRFFYSPSLSFPKYEYACSGCGSRSFDSTVGAKSCSSCDRNMLVVGGL